MGYKTLVLIGILLHLLLFSCGMYSFTGSIPSHINTVAIPLFDDNTSFLDDGIVDSTGIIELVNFMEETYEISIEDEELIPENFDSINKVVSFVERKMNLTENR